MLKLSVGASDVIVGTRNNTPKQVYCKYKGPPPWVSRAERLPSSATAVRELWRVEPIAVPHPASLLLQQSKNRETWRVNSMLPLWVRITRLRELQTRSLKGIFASCYTLGPWN